VWTGPRYRHSEVSDPSGSDAALRDIGNHGILVRSDEFI
ncbi:unnamed protein product, partial [Acidocella sp. C78]